MQTTHSFDAFSFLATFCSTLLLLFLGCTRQSGPPLAEVSGIVTLDGRPVQNAGLEFIADAGGVAYGKTDASGRYHMSFGASRTGAIVGKNRVRITAGDKVTVGDKKYESTEVFPKKYNAGSEEFVEVARGSNRFDFTCQSGNFQPRQSISRGGN
jgi:hypothetical protein